MLQSDLVLYQDDHDRIMEVIRRLFEDTAARLVVLVDKSGQEIAANGDTAAFDTTSLASLTAGNVAATDGLAQLLGEKEFTILFHEGERDNIHISVVAQRVILIVIFDQRSSLGLVRLRVRRATVQLDEVFKRIFERGEDETSTDLTAAAFEELTEQDINRLFGE